MLLIAQSHDGIQGRGFARGIKSKKNADGETHAEGEHNGLRRDDWLERGDYSDKLCVIPLQSVKQFELTLSALPAKLPEFVFANARLLK